MPRSSKRRSSAVSASPRGKAARGIWGDGNEGDAGRIWSALPDRRRKTASAATTGPVKSDNLEVQKLPRSSGVGRITLDSIRADKEGDGTMSTIFMFCALIGGTFLVCQFVMTLIGLGHEGFDTDVAHVPSDSLPARRRDVAGGRQPRCMHGTDGSTTMARRGFLESFPSVRWWPP